MLSQKILKVLQVLNGEGVVDVYTLARKLGISIGEVESLLGLLLSQGYIKQEKVENPCDSCPLSSACPLFGKNRSIRLYILTSRGESLLRKFSRS